MLNRKGPGKIPGNYCRCLYLSGGQVGWINELWFKRYLKMHPVFCNNTHHDVTDFVNHGMIKNTKTWILKMEHKFSINENIFNLRLRWHSLSYYFVAEVTLKARSDIPIKDNVQFRDHRHIASSYFPRFFNPSSINFRIADTLPPFERMICDHNSTTMHPHKLSK